MTAAITKTDNHNPRGKLELRRYFLRKYHPAGQALDVFDCCQATGFLWRTLSREFEVTSYWGVDLKPMKGRLKIDSVRVLSQPGWPQNVIDVDTYGAPWKHWEALLPHVTRSTTVFLTIGKLIGAGGFVATDKATAQYLGAERLHVPPTLVCLLAKMALPYALARASEFNLRLVEAVEAITSAPHARYVGVRLEPVGLAVDPPQAAGRRRRKRRPAASAG